MSNPPDVSMLVIDRDDLALVIASGVIGASAPAGLTAAAALACFPDGTADDFRRAADRVAHYLAERLNGAGLRTDLVPVPADGVAGNA